MKVRYGVIKRGVGADRCDNFYATLYADETNQLLISGLLDYCTDVIEKFDWEVVNLHQSLDMYQTAIRMPRLK